MSYLSLSSGRDDYVEAIKDGEIVKVLESVAIEEDLFILRKVISAEEEVLSPVVDNFRKDIPKTHKLDDWKAGRFGMKKNNISQDLVPNFHWLVSRARRSKNITRKFVADSVGCSEEDLKMLELGEVPYNDFIVISRIEKFLGISLRKDVPKEVTLADLQKRKETLKEVKNEGFDEVVDLSGDDIQILE